MKSADRSLKSEVDARFSVAAGVGLAGDEDRAAAGLRAALGEGEQNAVDRRISRENSECYGRDDRQEDDDCLH